MKLSRRHLLGLAPGLLAPGALRAGRRVERADRCFLFVFCRGGWDTTYCFTPPSGDVEGDPEGVTAAVGDLTFVDSPSRPAVRSFFEDYADRAAVLNGIEVRSVTHDRCTQFVLTGRGDGAADDWPTLLAAASTRALLLPHLVMSGPVYIAEHAAQVVRVGATGQLPSLLDGTAISLRSDRPVAPPPDAVGDLVDQYVVSRAEAAGDFGASYAVVLDQIDALRAYEDQLSFGEESGTLFCGSDPLGQTATVLDCFELGLSRCGMIQYEGWCANSFDTHAVNSQQSQHFDELFTILSSVVSMIDDRGLRDRVTLVVISEMGREPHLNGAGGKGHWTYTSAMLLGAGVRGGQVVGAMDDAFVGRPIDLASGAVTDAGVSLRAAHLGATLLELGGVDPGPHVEDGIAAIGALIEG